MIHDDDDDCKHNESNDNRKIVVYIYLTIIIGKALDKRSWITMYKCNFIYIYIVHKYSTQ